MKILEVKEMPIHGVKAVVYQRFADDRGYFTETFRESDLTKEIPEFSIRQVNESYSMKNVVRGLHFQWNPYQGKLVRTIKGHMIDMFLDIRKNSSTYGKIAALDMPSVNSDSTAAWIWLPVGIAHGCVFLEETAIEYFCTSEYSPGNEAGINPLSADLDWSLCDPGTKSKIDEIFKGGLIISDKDKQGLSLADWAKDTRSEYFL